MTEDELQSIFSSLGNLTYVGQYFSSHPELLEDLLNISQDDSQAKSWRAAWMIDKIQEKHPDLIAPYFTRIAQLAMTTQNNGKRRHFLKIISLCAIPDEYTGTLLNYSIELFTDPGLPVAVRVHAMQVLYNIAEKEPDFTGELMQLIEHEIEYHGSAGISSRGRKLIKKLKEMSRVQTRKG